MRSGYCISHALRQERSEYTWFSLLEKANASSNGRAFAFFVTGIPGDEEKRAGMALQYPLFTASAIQISSLFCLLAEQSIQQTRISIAKPEQTGKANLTE